MKLELLGNRRNAAATTVGVSVVVLAGYLLQRTYPPSPSVLTREPARWFLTHTETFRTFSLIFVIGATFFLYVTRAKLNLGTVRSLMFVLILATLEGIVLQLALS